MSCFFFAVYLLSTPMAIQNQHSSSNSNASHKAQPSLRHHCRRLSLLPPRRPWHLLLLRLALLHQMLQTCSHDPFYRGFALCFSFVVRLPHMPMVINAACVQLSYKCI
ncbi:uncharacterized protein BJ212DRAFT_1328642 [Suillus subaureus]|uniref:Secreted protein n=1 Tax=Suillus subaureus TaxID=48587 RepID=A0A9P7EHW7_9AGAM|nr:uncharacterized protein BJ212DRAFT_1328642 [Suillus subaureus]KAG1822532.1 hypothetical protein BJ212DRAFT_1328642 [Suillus subaureus]